MKQMKTGLTVVACLATALGAHAARMSDVAGPGLVQEAAAPACERIVAEFTSGIQMNALSPDFRNANGDSRAAGYEMLAKKKTVPKKPKGGGKKK